MAIYRAVDLKAALIDNDSCDDCHIKFSATDTVWAWVWGSSNIRMPAFQVMHIHCFKKFFSGVRKDYDRVAINEAEMRAGFSTPEPIYCP